MKAIASAVLACCIGCSYTTRYVTDHGALVDCDPRWMSGSEASHEEFVAAAILSRHLPISVNDLLAGLEGLHVRCYPGDEIGCGAVRAFGGRIIGCTKSDLSTAWGLEVDLAETDGCAAADGAYRHEAVHAMMERQGMDGDPEHKMSLWDEINIPGHCP